MTNAESFKEALKTILLKSPSQIHLAKTNLQLERKSGITELFPTSQSILSSALMPENVKINIHTIVLRNVLPSSLSSVKDVTALLAHATAAKDTSAAGSTSTSMKRMLHATHSIFNFQPKISVSRLFIREAVKIMLLSL